MSQTIGDSRITHARQ